MMRTVLINALVILAILVGVALLTWSLSPAAKRRSNAWRQRTVEQHGLRGYQIRSLLWGVAPLLVAAAILVLPRLLH